MKTKTLLAITLVLGVIFSSCEEFGTVITPSPRVTTETRQVSGFTGLDVSHAFNVYVNFSETEESIEIEANENLHDYIVVEKKNGNLVIKLKDFIHLRMGTATLNAYITCDYLKDFDASGASSIILYDPLDTRNVTLDLSGASDFSGEIEVDDLVADISGASNLELSGYADYLRIDASGASSLRDYSLSVNWFDADLSGASDASITINDRIDLEASGASTLNYRGSAQINHIDLSGASNINRVD